MKHKESNRKVQTASAPAEALRRRWRIISTIVIALWAAWALLDAFVVPRDIVAVEESGAASSAPADADSKTGPDGLPGDGGMTETDPPAESGGEAVPDTLTDDVADPGPDTLTDAAVAPGKETGGKSGSDPDISGSDPGISEPEPEMGEAPLSARSEPVITDHSYDDGLTTIEISTMRTLDTDIYIAEVTLTHSSRMRTGLAGNAFGRNLTEPTSVIAERNNAIFAVNGDYYGFRDTGYVMRNGYLYRSDPGKDPEQEDLVLYENGAFAILREADVTAEEIRDSGATDIFSFGPGLVMDGEITVSEDDEVERAQVTNPRTAIGLLSPLHYLFVVSDGRTDESVGLSLYELAGLMKDLGCITAYNLDGGGSSTMWFNGRVLNRPTTFGDKISERNVSDIVYIGKQ